MKPPKFDYHVPATVREAVELLAEADKDTVVLSGGQSLIPMLNLRLANPTDIVDLGNVAELRSVAATTDGLEIGAMVTHSEMEADPTVAERAPLAQSAAGYIGYRAIRNRGTIGGSVAHADPAAEWPVVVLALDGAVTLASTRGSRVVFGDDFFESLFTTAKRPDELVTSIQLSGRFARHWGFSEFQRRTGDFAVVAVAVACTLVDGLVNEARVAIAGVAERPVRCPAAEGVLVGSGGDGSLSAAAAEAARDAFEPAGDIHGSSAFRKRLVFAETRRAVAQALGPARVPGPGPGVAAHA